MDEPFSVSTPSTSRCSRRPSSRCAIRGAPSSVQHPPDGDGRGAVRRGRDHRPAAAWSWPARSATSGVRTGRRSSASPYPATRSWAGSTARPDATVGARGSTTTRSRSEQSVDPETVLREALDRGRDVTRFEIADPSIEDIFIERVGAMTTEERDMAAVGAESGR